MSLGCVLFRGPLMRKNFCNTVVMALLALPTLAAHAAPMANKGFDPQSVRVQVLPVTGGALTCPLSWKVLVTNSSRPHGDMPVTMVERVFREKLLVATAPT